MSSKTKRQRKNKKFKYHVKRKKLRKKQLNTGVAGNSVPIVREAWEDGKSIRSNLISMGLSYDPNVTIKIPTAKDLLRPIGESEEEQPAADATVADAAVPEKAYVADELEAEAKAPREKKFQFPNGQVLFLSYLIDKYGDDYQAMARDKKNIYQETSNQIRKKIMTFQKIPSQWNKYLASRSNGEKS